MPNFLGIYTKQEMNDIEAAFTTPLIEAKIRQYASYIKIVQAEFPLTQRLISVKEVVPKKVADFFDISMQYTVVDSVVGQPAGMTFLTSIAW